MKSKLYLLKSFWKPIITVSDQQIHQNGFPCISTILGTYYGTGDSETDDLNDIITYPVKLDNQINTPTSFSTGDEIRFNLQHTNSTYNNVKLRFVDITGSLEVVVKRPNSEALFPDNSLNPNTNYIAQYDVGGFFQITEVEGYSTKLVEQNYVHLEKSIKSVIKYCSDFTGRTIIDGSYRFVFDSVEDSSSNLYNIVLPTPNIYNVEKVTYINDSDVETEIDLSTFSIETCGTYDQTTYLCPSVEDGFEVPSDVSTTETYPYAVYYDAGYENNQIPQDLRHGLMQHCAFLWANRGDMVNYAEIKEYKTLDKCDVAKDIYKNYKYLSV